MTTGIFKAVQRRIRSRLLRLQAERERERERERGQEALNGRMDRGAKKVL